MTDIATASHEELVAELDRVNHAGYEASELFAFLDPFTKAGREAESTMTKLMIRRRAILARLRELSA